MIQMNHTQDVWSFYYCFCQLPDKLCCKPCYCGCDLCLKCIYCFDYFDGYGDYNQSSCYQSEENWCCQDSCFSEDAFFRLLGMVLFPFTCTICCVNGFNLFCVRGLDNCCGYCYEYFHVPVPSPRIKTVTPQTDDDSWIKPPPIEFSVPPPYPEIQN
jgi:hypothetical protein